MFYTVCSDSKYKIYTVDRNRLYILYMYMTTWFLIIALWCKIEKIMSMQNMCIIECQNI